MSLYLTITGPRTLSFEDARALALCLLRATDPKARPNCTVCHRDCSACVCAEKKG